MEDNTNQTVEVDNTWLRMDILRTLLATLGRDFVTEDVIRDVKKIERELFS